MEYYRRHLMRFASPTVRSAGLLVAAKVASYVFPLVVLPILTRALGPSAYGELVFATSLISIFSLVIEYGAQVTATRAVARAREDDAKTSSIVSRVVTFRLLMCLAGYLVLFGVSTIQGYGSSRFKLLSLAYLINFGDAITLSWFFIGREIPLGLVVTSLASRVLTLPLVALLVRSSSDLEVAVFLVTLPALLGGVLALPWALRSFHFTFRRPSMRSLWSELRDGLAAALSGVAASVNQPLTVVLLGSAAAGATIGEYGTALVVVTAGKQLLMPLSQVAYARTSFLEGQSPERLVDVRTRAVLWVCAWGALASLGLLIGAPLITTVLFGKAFAGSAALIRMMSILPLLFICGQAVGTQFLFSSGRGRVVVAAMAAGNLACLGSVLLLTGRFQANGSALSLVIGEAVATGLMVWAGSLTRKDMQASVRGARPSPGVAPR
jgi:PST family polysaccharide transporter